MLHDGCDKPEILPYENLRSVPQALTSDSVRRQGVWNQWQLKLRDGLAHLAGVMKLTLASDWKWSKDIKPIVGAASCPATHVGIIAEGTIHCVCDDGSEATYTAGDAYAISPNHDAWCVIGKQAVVYEFAGMWEE